MLPVVAQQIQRHIETESLDLSPRFLGSDSCATSTCHGNVVGQGPLWNHSLSVYAANDPHATAGRILSREVSPLSESIVVLLDPNAKTSTEAYTQVLQKHCISCHGTVTPDQCDSSNPLKPSVLYEGVSCEACHGGASQWIDDHLNESWIGPSRFLAATGMRDTESIVGRAKNCVRCHVGSRSEDGLVRDMNHDLIAAGHPALRFDLLIYNENLPHHWSSDSEVEENFSASAIRLRKVSRATNLSAAAALSSARASDHLRDVSIPWPELSDYDCFACHQSLTMSRYDVPLMNQVKTMLRVSDGLPIWNTWHSTDQLNLRDSISYLEILSPHRSDPRKVASIGNRIAARYQKLASKIATEAAPDTKTELNRLLALLQKNELQDWHAAAVNLLTLDAIIRDLPDQQRTVLAADVAQLESMLRFDSGDRSSKPPKHSPGGFDPQEYRARVIDILTSRLNPATKAP
ncbi:cytochrome c3 family protein [Rubripirellula obstinata]|uniref:cytochrome c3 family protein n=1 Tax=Rubripirellula obstinata TaxID=406547 RepID=UPI0013900629|nr:cytochrome c3 family protein [Rubripirellula obstinata]